MMRWRFFLFGLLIFIGNSLPCQATVTKAVRGQIDLSTLDMTNGDVIALDGEWTFYWKQLLTPADFEAGTELIEPTYLPAPLNWSEIRMDGQALPSKGFATYRLRIIPPLGTHGLAMRINEVSSAYKLWINDRFALECGTVGRDAATEEKDMSRRIVQLPSDGQPIDLLLQVSNFHGQGNSAPRIRLGAAETINLSQGRDVALAAILAGGMLVMCIYHLALYFMRHKELSFLYFSLYCLIRIDYTIFQGASDGVIRLVFPDIRGPVVYGFIMLGLYLSPIVSLAFFRSLYPNEFSFRVLISAAVVTAGLLITAAVTGFVVPQAVQLFFYGYSMLLIVYYVYCLFRAWQAKRIGAGLILIGYMVLGISLVNDMLMDMYLIQTTNLIPLGMFAFVLFQSFALARRFTMAFSSVELLSNQLEEQNEVLQAEMAEHIRLEHEIELVGEKERRAMSRELHDGLCQQLTAARLHCSVLRRSRSTQDKPDPEIEKMAGLLHGAVDHAYEISRGLWPVEHEDRDLVMSLEEMAARIRASYHLEVSLHYELADKRCHNAHASPIFHIAREALHNVCKHASASFVRVILDCRSMGHTLLLRIEDDGVGRIARPPSSGGLGMRIMAHRARSIGGNLTICDRRGGGTVVRLTVPCAATTCPPINKAAP